MSTHDEAYRWPLAFLLAVLLLMGWLMPRGWERHAENPGGGFPPAAARHQAQAVRKSEMAGAGDEASKLAHFADASRTTRIEAPQSPKSGFRPWLSSVRRQHASARLPSLGDRAVASQPRPATPLSLAAKAVVTEAAEHAPIAEIAEHGSAFAPSLASAAEGAATLKPIAVGSDVSPGAAAGRVVWDDGPWRPSVRHWNVTLGAGLELRLSPDLLAMPIVVEPVARVASRFRPSPVPDRPALEPTLAPGATRRIDAPALELAEGISGALRVLASRTTLPSAAPEHVAPKNLEGRLAALRNFTETSAWAERALGQLSQWEIAGLGDGPHFLMSLTSLAAEAEQLAAAHESKPQLAAEVRRTAYSLSRHLLAWRPTAHGSESPAPPFEFAAVSPWIAAPPLALSTELAAAGGLVLPAESFASPLAGEALAEAVAVTGGRFELLAPRVVRYENSLSGQAAHELAAVLVELREQGSPSEQSRAQELLDIYRGANVRLTVRGELVARLSESRAPVMADVRQRILGVPVEGSAVTTTSVGLRLAPSDHCLRLAIEASGQISSRTTTHQGPAWLFNRSETTYRVWKDLEVSPRGVQGLAPHVSIDGTTRLRGVESDLDWVPFLGGLTRGIIRRQYEERRHAAHAEMERLVRAEVQARVEREIAPRVDELNRQIGEHVFVPLEQLGVNADWEMQTTEERLLLRSRLAAPQQLAASTPRPRAPAGSLASLQLHESALNNVVERLELDGRALSLRELHKLLSEKLNLTSAKTPESMPHDVQVRFAEHDAVRLRFHEGHAKLTLRLAEVSHETDHWRNFEVYVFYRPDFSVPGGQLLRDGVVQLNGGRVRVKGQVALRAIFSRIFAKQRGLTFIPAKIADDERLADLRATQIVLEDGWLGWAIAPAPNANATAPSATTAPEVEEAQRFVPRVRNLWNRRTAARLAPRRG